MFDFAGKVAVITGAASGIGEAAATYFLSCGARVLIADINQDVLSSIAKKLDPSGTRVVPVGYDAADAASAARVIARGIEAFGALDYLVASAGIYRSQVLPEITDEQWRQMIGVNLDGIFYISRAAIPYMRDGGAIVNVASVAAHQGGTYGNSHYGASKGGVLAYTRGLARDIAPRLRANCVSPGWIETPMVAAALEEHGDKLRSAIPLQRPGKPHEIASVIAFLCSDASSFITGEAIIAAGGAYMG